MHLSASAATDVVHATDASASTSHTSSATSTVTSCSASWTNNTGASVPVQVETGFGGAFAYSPSALSEHTVFLEQTGAAEGDSTETVTNFAGVWAGNDTYAGANRILQWTVDAGDTLSLTLKVRTTTTNTPGPSLLDQLTIDAGFIRVTAIKR